MTNKKTTKTTALLVAGVLATSCFVGGTIARYVTSTSSEDSARVAVWGINADGVEMNLFASEYDVNGNKVAKSWNGDKIIAPGTSMASNFSIVNLDDTLAPEVMYEIKIDVDDTEIDQRILDNPSIQWKLDDNAFGTWEETKAAILALSGDASGVKTYAPNTVATDFANGETHTIAWQWIMDNNNDPMDTQMGNEATAGDITAKISVRVTARQVQEDTTGLLSGSGQTFNMAAPTDLTFRSAAPFTELRSVTVNGTPLTADAEYTATEGSTVITLKKDYLESLEAGSYTLNIISQNTTVTTTFKVESNLLAVDENGNYLVSTADDLFLLAEIVNSGAWANQEVTVLMTNDIDLQNREFTPIGTIVNSRDIALYGTFDGQDHTIYNLKVTATDEATNKTSTAALFGFMGRAGAASPGTTIQNLKIDGAVITGTHFAAAIAGTSANNGSIIDCEVKNATITSTYYDEDNSGDKAGVIIGNAHPNIYISGCKAESSTVTASRDAGQIAGKASPENVVDCTATDVTVSHNGLGTGANIRNELIGRI